MTHPLLRKYIKFFWEIRTEHLQLNHALIPQRNINLRFNLSETPQYVNLNGSVCLLEDVYFSGLWDHFRNLHLTSNGKVHMLGVCFAPEGFYPFLQVPVSEFKNRLLGAREIGFKRARTLCDRLKEASDVATRLSVLENELVAILTHGIPTPDNFRELFQALSGNLNPQQLSEFCKQHNIGMRQLERMYNKYIGISATTYGTLNRFHGSLNQLLRHDYSRLSDVAFDNGYFDQMHFIRDFKRFAGNTPKSFVHQNNSILQVGKLT